MNRLTKLVPWLLAVYIAYIFVWYLQFKFTGGEGSIWLFTVLTDWLGAHGYEKVMRIGTGTAELVASILVLIPATQIIGAALSCGIMAGAIFFHVVSPLGIDPYQDGGELFKEAVTVFLAGLVILALRREEVVRLIRRVPPLARVTGLA
ncbi:MAG: DoxX family protein [Proteobacteria bacterium]|nr:DoxX family protein [Pseudomonadota bacterium]MBI3496635.1 DoxX family protein [Pseudomonadota bacterium]